MQSFKKIHISSGDPAGIGPEIVFKSIKTYKPICPIIVHAPSFLCDDYAKIYSLSLKEHGGEKEGFFIQPYQYKKEDYSFGKNSRYAGEIAATSIIKAQQFCTKEDVLITAPVSKEALNLAGYHVQGHTQFLAKLTNSNDVFMSFWGKINTLLLTNHVSMQEVVNFCSNPNNIYEKIKTSYPLVEKVMGKKPKKFALAALNPHAGENGLMGREEFFLKEVVEKLKMEGMDIDGPIPSDTLFLRYLKGEFNFIYSIYHDQALIPIKTFFLDSSVNMTLGLPFVRISPDHGTAFEIAGKNEADISPFIYTLDFASSIIAESLII